MRLEIISSFLLVSLSLFLLTAADNTSAAISSSSSSSSSASPSLDLESETAGSSSVRGTSRSSSSAILSAALKEHGSTIPSSSSTTSDSSGNNKKKTLSPYRVQTGRVTRSSLHNKKNPPTNHIVWVPFSPSFPLEGDIPDVFVGISEFKTLSPQLDPVLRMQAVVSRTNTSGFELILGSWIEPGFPHIAVSWIATDLPAEEVQMFHHEQNLRKVEWGLQEARFEPALIAGGSNSDHHHATTTAVSTQEFPHILKQAMTDPKSAPRVLSVISKFEQQADAFWAKLEVDAMSVTPAGFTSVIRPWGDAPTYFTAASHFATVLHPAFLQVGSHSVADHERLGAPKISFSQRMLCSTPSVLVFIKAFDQGPPIRSVKCAAQRVTPESFDLFFDLRDSSETWKAKFSWLAVC